MTASKLNLKKKELAALGLEGAMLDEGHLIPWPEDDIGHGAVKETLTLTLLALVTSGAARFSPVGLSLEGDAELAMLRHRQRHVIRYSSPEPKVSVRTVQGGEENVVTLPEAPGTLFVEIEPGGTVVVEPHGGRRQVLVSGPEGLKVYLELQPVAIESLADIAPPPVGDWHATQDDTWLQQEAQARLAAGTSWGNAVGAGLCARLQEPSAERAKEVIEKLMRGEADMPLAEPRLWARSLTQEQVKTLEDLALAEVDWLHEQLDQYREDSGPEDDRWRRGLSRLCCARDDLEGVSILLAEAGAGQRLASALSALDDAGDTFVLGLPKAVVLQDEQLRRARLADPDAWWAQPAELAST